jgi:sigma-B regulation protein RsbU (phosphoserine phosphatase)
MEWAQMAGSSTITPPKAGKTALLVSAVRQLTTSADPSCCLNQLLHDAAQALDIGPVSFTTEQTIREDTAVMLGVASRNHRYGVLRLPHVGRGRHDPAREFFKGLAAVAGLALEAQELRANVHRQSTVASELELAAEIQRNQLPPPRPDGFPVLGLNRPARQVSGDFFDYFVAPDRRIPFALGDVSGKGINAALLMAKTASLFRCLAKSISDPGTLLAAINRELCETTTRGMFVTMIAGVYDPRSGIVKFANAGHEPPLHRRVDRTYSTFPAAAPPLGILADVSFADEEIGLDGGEFYVFTDGLTEFAYDGKEQLGADGLIHLLEAYADMPFGGRLASLLKELDAAGWEARDDLTVLAIDDAWTGDPEFTGHD